MPQDAHPSGADNDQTPATVLAMGRVKGGGGVGFGRDMANDAHVGGSSATDGPFVVGKKRKSPDRDVGSGLAEATSRWPGRDPKKIKLPGDHANLGALSVSTPGNLPGPDWSLLPREVWHYVLTYCPPKSLGKLLAVNKRFNVYLDPASPVHADLPSVTHGALRPMEPNAIWQASRRLFWPQMPAPLRSSPELDMWRLACSPRCQACGRVNARGQTAQNPLHPGPGTDGVAVIWAFGSRMCSACLLKSSDKEVDLQISPSIPSAIIPALPFVFLTQDRDVFTATMLEANQIPADLEVTKLFSKSDVQALQEEFLQVKDMGQGTVSEWLKGLPGRGSDIQHDASKWEKWESSGGLAKMCSLLHPGYEAQAPMTQKPSTNTIPTTLASQGRQERTAEQAAELKAARKAEIERRSLLLDPPLSAEVLGRIPAFQAATHIVARLDDEAWERLKPRLLAQRADAEKTLQSEPKSEPTDGQPNLDTTTLATDKEARDRVDKHWEVAQAPLRVRIANYADEVIRDSWGKGKKVTRESCSRFAVDSLIYVRARFYAEVAKDAATAKAAGKSPPLDPPEGPFTQKLTLENMKWIFDSKFKPHTEPLRKELFYCNGCEGNYKSFGFEGVIQHYAAKHTSTLSRGSIVVHWRAEWPEHPPFSATARSAKSSSHPRAPGGFTVNGGAPLPPNYSYQTPGTVPAPLGPGYPYGYTPPTYSGHYQPPPLPQPTAAAPFVPAASYEQQPPYVAPAAAYPAYPPPGLPYTGPAVEPPPNHAPPRIGHYDYQYGPYQANGIQHTSAQPSTYPGLGQTQVDDIARNSREVWRVLSDIRDLPGNVKVSVTIHHLVKRFQSRFYETPPLSMFIDGLSNNKEMRPVRNVNGLVCKACHLGLGNAVSVEQDRKNFSLPQLANHFQSRHIEPMQSLQAAAEPLDWVTDMVLVPNLALLPSIASSANEPQKALLSAAFPTAFEPPPPPATDQLQSQSGQGGQISNEAHPTSTADAWRGPLATGSHLGRSTAMDPVKASLFSGYRTPGESSHSTIPTTLLENEHRVAHNAGDRYSPHGSRLGWGQGGLHNDEKVANEKREGRDSQNGDDSGDEDFGKHFKNFKNGQEKKARNKKKKLEEKRARREKRLAAWKEKRAHGEQKSREGKGVREEADVRTMRATTRAATQLAQSSFGVLEGVKTGAAPQSQAPAQQNAQASQQIGESSSNKEQEPGSYFDQRPIPQSQGQQATSNPTLYANNGPSEVPPAFRTSRGTHDQHGDREAWARHFLPADERQADPVYYSRPAPVESPRDAYGPQRIQAGYPGPLPGYAQEERLGPPAPRTEGGIHGTSLPEADYRRYRDDVHMAPRPPVEAYEIVHVIDEHGEYYIRRPARREPDSRYLYEERRIRHDAGPYPTREHLYDHVSRPGLVPEGYRGSVASDSRPGNRRADPGYHEEYDPRFPAA
ncbi:uncharacterized protein B0H64DRAFT_32769 [Chaetomium fimeti]|uniref:F-box domain-containing protein n=1 Tax=Chaetomium fimeti TaxID=1854472 RepID=A0AAE0HR35_9PEZI|nr:hypothetical protein B0H64DRAFT_32769 [Chaetomium fimeti]